jgi:EAL domain-containing protein (putative c-di-GMP-specific phosphodiesterase class I)
MPHTLHREYFKPQDLVFNWGDPGDSAYVIEEGCVEVLAGEGALQRRIALLTEGAMFGEIALLDQQPRTASVRALVPTRLIRIDRSHVEELLLRADPVIQYLLGLLLSRFRRTHDVAGQAPENLDLHSSAMRTLSLAQDLSHAIDRGQLELFYQPLIAFEGLQLEGFEALIRWRHPTLGVVNPDEFITLAEKTGLIHRIGRWVLQQACTDWLQLRSFCAATQPFISVNLSAAELAEGATVDAIANCLAQHGLPAPELHIELTETAIIQNMSAVSASLERLRALGVGIALDDFGTGYAGLDYLQSLPFSSLKIDKTFVQQMGESERSNHIIRAALELAGSLGLSTIAEGIEDGAIGEQLAAMGCTHAQGYFYGRPMPLQDVAGWAARHNAQA